jgi:hypothetical protein
MEGHATRTFAFVTSTMKEERSRKQGAHRLIFGMQPNKKYYEEVALNGTSNLFPFSTGNR